MKRKIRLLSLILASSMLLTACTQNVNDLAQTSPEETSAASSADKKEESTEEITTENTEETPEETFEDTSLVTDKSQFPTDLYGPEGDNISTDEMTEVRRYGEELPWDYITCEGFTYISEPTGISCNSIENADIFNSADNSFTGGKTNSEAVYKRYNAGDEICGLTIDTAKSRFQYSTQYGELKERYFSGGEVTFKGEKELTGYLVILSEDLYAVGMEGDIVFIPDNESQTLPLLNYNNMSKDKGAFSTQLNYAATIGDITFQNEYGFISLGNIKDYPDEMFMGAEHNKALKARAVLGEIYMSSTIEWFVNTNAVIKSLKFE